MTHNQDPLAQTRRDFLKNASRLAGVMTAGMLLDGCGTSGKGNKEARFATSPNWEQDFSRMPNGLLDPKMWNIDKGNTIPGYNNEAQTLTARSQNVRIEDGKLILEARKERLHGKEYTSGHVNTQGKFSFQTGKIEVDLKPPKGVGTWPAAWLLPNKDKYDPRDYGIDPEKDTIGYQFNGEIDFFEGVGAQPGQVYPAIHNYNSLKSGKNSTKHIDLPHETEEFNTFGVELTPGKIAFSCNGKVYHAIEKTSDDPRDWPYDQPYYLILNLAMGGTWGGEKKKQFPPDGIQGDGPWQMAVKAVRYYELES